MKARRVVHQIKDMKGSVVITKCGVKLLKEIDHRKMSGWHCDITCGKCLG